MNRKFLRAAFSAAALLVLASLGLGGCAQTDLVGNLVPNQRPSVELTNAPATPDSATPYFYAYKVNWSGNDPDGRVAFYEYAVDPPHEVIYDTSMCNDGDTCWIRTEKNEETVFFRASQPDTIIGNNQPTASDPHVFVIRAVDDDGAASARRNRAFWAYTIAPSIAVRNPIPNKFISVQVTPSVRIEWEGSDVDGQFSQKPVKYKYYRFNRDDLTGDNDYLAHPDRLRRREAANNFAGWDSTSADTNFVQFTNLTPGQSYVFVVIGFDEAGAYSPVWSLDSNMLQFTAGYAAANGPRIHIFNQFIDYTYDSGGYSTDPLREIVIEVPTNVSITVNWDAIATQGSNIQSFRWMVDGNINDETKRNDERNDYQYWSRTDPTMPNSVVLRPFLTDGEHRFYLECGDNNGQKSLGILKMITVTPSFDKNLVVVNDTRLEVNKYLGDPVAKQLPDIYTKGWPSKCELDTFLFARGGFPWRGTRNPPTGVTSTPGVMAGYEYDTLGTRRGLENPALGVLLSRIGQYKNLIWLVDETGATYIASLEQSIFPVTALYAMSGPGRASTLAAYTQLGGRVWMAGGGTGHASLKNFDRPGNNVGQTTVFSSAVQFGELAPGRIMYDGAHWQSEIGVSKGPYRTFRYEFTVNQRDTNGVDFPVTYVVKKPWSHHYFYPPEGTLSSPNYSKLPVELRPNSGPPADPLPPTRLNNQTNLFYSTSFPVEYILTPNFIVEDVDPDPETVRNASVLDTLFEAEGVVLRTTPRPGQAVQRAPIMTYYHGRTANQFVFSGFAPWYSARQDCISVFDFVLQDLWGLPRAGIDRGSFAPANQRNAGAKPARSASPLKRSANALVSTGTRE
jgi:hypothetical protein